MSNPKTTTSHSPKETPNLPKGARGTPHIPAHKIEARWLLIDAKDQIVGRLATFIAKLLMGKDKANFSPAVDAKTNVVIINADKVQFTGNKLEKKPYYTHSGYPGGLKVRTPKDILEGSHPQRVITNAVNGMLPKNKLRNIMMKRLFAYTGKQHPHMGQEPKLMKNE